VSTKDTFTVHIGIILLGITIIARETLFGVGNVETTIGGTLEGSKDTTSGGGGFASNIQKGAEGALVFVYLINVVCGFSNLGLDNIAIDFVIAFVDIIQPDLLKETTGTQETSTVGGGVVLETDRKSVAGQFVGAGRGQNTITVNEGVDDLANDLTVGETEDEAVLG
jgi:hypothetical protein